MPEIQPVLQVFLSAATRDFGSERSTLARSLAKQPNLTVREQSNFLSSGNVLLSSIDEYIKNCHAVYHLVGISSGEFITQAEADWLVATYPDFLTKLPFLAASLDSDPVQLSYTQLEAWLAKYHNIRLYPLFEHASSKQPETDSSQAQHFQRLENLGLHRMSFANDADLRELVWSHLIQLPFTIKEDRAIIEQAAQNRRFSAISARELINDRMLPRKESVDQAVAAILDPEKRGALVIAPAGYGKSCVIEQITERLRADSIPYLAIKLDSSDVCNTAKQLGSEFDLSNSPAKLLASVAKGTPCVLVVDQLDAMSMVSGRKVDLWQAFAELRDEALGFPNMKLLLGCRDFDLVHDYRLIEFNKDEKLYAKVRVKELSHEEIKSSIALAQIVDFVPTIQKLEVLTVPLHLFLFLQGDPSKSFNKASELFETFWNRKRTLAAADGIDEQSWNAVLFDVAKYMSDGQTLFIPRALVANRSATIDKLVSLNVLNESTRGYKFFHESFFDYTYARSFCLQQKGLVGFLRDDPQHLFRRGQVRQILTYRRSFDNQQYLVDLSEMLSATEIRFHLKRMVASELARIESPTYSEWKIVEPYALDGNLSRYVTSALRGHAGWFDVLDSTSTLENWLRSGQERFINLAMWFLSDSKTHDHRSARIAEFLEPFENDDVWADRFKAVFSWGLAHKGHQMKSLYFRLVERGVFENERENQQGDGFWSNNYNAAKEDPHFIIDLVALWLRYAATKYDDGTDGHLFDKSPVNRSNTGADMVREAAQLEPFYFVSAVLPVFAEIVRRTSTPVRDRTWNRGWAGITNLDHAFDVDDSVLIELRRALEQLAKTQTSLFREHASAIANEADDVVAYLLLNAFAANPSEYADECIEYLLARPNRLNLGYSAGFSMSKGDSMESAVARMAISKISLQCSAASLTRLEDAIFLSCDQWERENPRQRGYGEYLLLQSIAQARQSHRTRVRIDELKQKFLDWPTQIPKPDRSSIGSFTGPPIPFDKAALMTDCQWILAMLKYDRRHDPGEGGPHELSQVLRNETIKNRSRFAALALNLPDHVAPDYFNAILDGMSTSRQSLSDEQRVAEQAKIDAINLQVFVSLIVRVHRLPGNPCGSSIVDAIAQLGHRPLPNAILDIVCFYATVAPDPDKDSWKADQENYYGGDPHLHGINCVRGRAARAIATLIYDDVTRLDSLLPTIRAVVTDRTVAVRTVAIEICTAVLEKTPELALELFLAATDTETAIFATKTFGRFVYFALSKHYDQLRPRLLTALNCEIEKCVEVAARNIIIAEISNVANDEDALCVRRGTVIMRQSAADVYAHNLCDSNVGDHCVECLRLFLNDDSEEVRKKVAMAFSCLNGKCILELQPFLSEFIESKSFEIGADFLLRSLLESALALPAIVVRAAERILDFLGDAGTNIAHRGAMTASSISKLVVRQYAQTDDEQLRLECLDLIDRMEQHGFLGIADELNSFDR